MQVPAHFRGARALNLAQRVTARLPLRVRIDEQVRRGQIQYRIVGRPTAPLAKKCALSMAEDGWRLSKGVISASPLRTAGHVFGIGGQASLVL